MFEKLFKLSSKGTTVKVELLAGLTTFLTMAYILAVNPGLLSNEFGAGMPFQSVFLATALSAALASIIMGLYANYPIALAPGMGVNAFFSFTAVNMLGGSWQAGLAAVFISGILFLVISLTGIRKMVINAIPKNLKLAIGAGIGFFIAFIGLQNAGIVVNNDAVLVGLGDLTAPTVLLAVFGILVTFALLARKISAGVFYGLVITAVVGVVAGLAGIEGMPALPTAIVSFNFDMPTFGAFIGGFDELFASPSAILIIFTFLFIDFFDTAGTLVAVAGKTNLIDEKGELENVDKALMADAVGTVAGAMLGTSTVTSYIESAAGVGVGGRTGLTAVTTGVLFILSIIFFPVLAVVNGTVTAPALIVVGVLMAQQLGGIDWDDFVAATSGFVAIITMILAYSIADGIATGFITYGVVMAASGKAKEVKPVIWVLIAIFIVHFILK
ncbi:MAG: NCS2 family permease [Firmicutes bacterium HGW-Firmicutes-10]|jgi:AGZA family xanthine/uracil permease-like MFS transporter|nr:MAG: NCS2 family permease [Firmicutes bacterium HGW-Firmicutes-10]